jgi:hypothetical protein
MTGFLTPDGSAATSATALAAMLHVHRNRISDWRRKGGPDSLTFAAWRQWFQTTGRERLVAEIDRISVEIPDVEDEPEEIPTPVATDEEAFWRTRRAKAQAERAEMDLAVAKGEVYRRVDVERAIRDLTASTAEILTQGIWSRLAPTLVCASPDLRRGIRTAHDHGMLDLRMAIIAACRDALAGVHP